MDNCAILAKDKLDDARRQDIQPKIDDCIAKVKRFLKWQIDNPDAMLGPAEALQEEVADETHQPCGIIVLQPLSPSSKTRS